MSSGSSSFVDTLPPEIVLSILDHCTVAEITKFRAVSRSFHNFVVTHESKLARRNMRTTLPQSALVYYPVPPHAKLSFKFVEIISYHQIVCHELAKHLGDQIVREMIMSANYFVPERYIDCLTKKLGMGISQMLHGIYYFFEEYRRLKLEAIKDGGELNEEQSQAIQYKILSRYGNQELLQSHRLFDLMVRLLRRRLCNRAFLFFLHTRIFQYKVKGWETTADRENFYASIFLMGGLPFMWSLYDVKGATNRRRFVSKWYKECRKGDEKSGFLDNLKGKMKEKMRREPPRYSSRKSEGHSYGLKAPSKAPVPPPSPAELCNLPIDPLSGLFLRASQQLLLERNVVKSLDDIRCRAQFVCALLGTRLTSVMNDVFELPPLHPEASTAGGGVQPIPFVSVDGGEMAGIYYFDGYDSDGDSEDEDDSDMEDMDE